MIVKLLKTLILFSLVLSLVFFSGCGVITLNSGNDVSGGTEKSSTDVDQYNPDETAPEIKNTVKKKDYSSTVEKYLSELPEYNGEGAVFMIATPVTAEIDPESAPEAISSALAKRNKLLEERYNVTIHTKKVDSSNYFSEVNAAAVSGTYFSDLLMLSQQTLGGFVAGTLLINLRSLPYIDFSGEYFCESGVGAGGGGYVTYGVTGNAVCNMSSIPAVFCRSDLSDKVISMVKDGSWTWDALFSAANDAGTASGIGVGGMEEALPETIYMSSGGHMINSTYSELPRLGFSAESTAKTTEILGKLYSEETYIPHGDEAINLFSGGEMPFLIDYASALDTLKDSASEWSILPMPKTDAAQEGYTALAGPSALFFAVPTTNATAEATSILLMAINAASYGTVRDSYTTYAMEELLRDNRSVEVFEYVINSAVYDLAYSYGVQYPAIASSTFNLFRSAASGSSLERLIAQWEGNANQSLRSLFPVWN